MPSSYPLAWAAERLGTTMPCLRRQLHRIGAITSDGRANPDWLQQGWLREQTRHYHHPLKGYQQYLRIRITAAGLATCWGLINKKDDQCHGN